MTSINDGDVVLDINFKSDGLVSLSEFRETRPVSRDEVDVYVEQQEDARDAGAFPPQSQAPARLGKYRRFL